MADGHKWEWFTDPGLPIWCITLTEYLTPDAVLRRYGADPGTARMLGHDEASDLYDRALRGGTVVRVGTAGAWAFGYEDIGQAGSRSGPLAALSRGTQTLSVLRGGDGTNRLAHWRDGQCREAFELGTAGRKPQGNHYFWDLVHAAGQTTPRATGLLLALRAITHHTGVVLSKKTLRGPLLTAHLAEEDRAPDPAPRHSPVPNIDTSALGRALGAVRPSPPSDRHRH
ncbi:DUF6461 domain-containing protein [Streptomyces daghestanicus]|uniref:Uncharacterized protein n=1 Tax=Streptomyces daghestanicus TaxID=66885 RepID=A0ABQ3Q7U8_9ACTN|nr:DUF6461 domain-containing protein [Streptomyces daghestanicus]GGU62710.1 hypothetical protein GCM10010259_61700 [Streptomyces daghestanicus]GHI33324.1 hypothetical protein Sdagh_50540 [Streptomyces daghestanicus]